MNIKVGQKAPQFELPTDESVHLSSETLKGKTYILYFYPKDNTPGCTLEACDFRDSMEAFDALDVSVIGVSKDSVQKHRLFKKKHKLNFCLLADEDGDLCRQYGVLKEKQMFGKKYLGIERSTFVIDGSGTIMAAWTPVKVKNHVQSILEFLKTQPEK